jgi:integrase
MGRLRWAAPHAEDFKGWLREKGYREPTIVEVVRLLAVWTAWIHANGFARRRIVAAFTASAATCRGGRTARAPRGAAGLFLRYLRDRELIPPPATLPSATERWPLLGAFEQWMREHRGIAESTLGSWQPIVVDLLMAVGDDPSAFTAEAVRAFVLERGRPHGRGRAKTIAVAIRAFLRFLVATGRCPPGREHAVPTFANWQLTSVPCFLPPEDIARVIDACGGEDRLRDRAIVLLLARLGLRASEVANLKLGDIDWSNGRLAICGKSRRAEWLPLTQEVGDAIVAYLERSRPRLPTPRLFVTHTAPLRPLSRIAVKCIVRRTLIRAGIECAHKGAHVLRHSAATAMLRSGVSLAGVSAVLRHRSPATTMHYAKVDLGLLSVIAQPWLGRLPC